MRGEPERSGWNRAALGGGSVATGLKTAAGVGAFFRAILGGSKGINTLNKAEDVADVASDLAKVAGAGGTRAVNPGQTVLRKFPDYLKLADELGAKRFNIPTSEWNKMTKAEQWAANQKFLDRAIARGDEVILSNPVKNISDVTGAFRQELDYLVSKGFKLSEDGSRMIR